MYYGCAREVYRGYGVYWWEYAFVVEKGCVMYAAEWWMHMYHEYVYVGCEYKYYYQHSQYQEQILSVVAIAIIQSYMYIIQYCSHHLRYIHANTHIVYLFLYLYVYPFWCLCCPCQRRVGKIDREVNYRTISKVYR